MEKITIGDTDVLLEELGEGKGKLIIANTYGYNYSSYWGAMGSTLREFIKKINSGYFISNLLPAGDRGVFDGKLTVSNVRKFIREEMKYELPWYEHMEAQKELREKLKEMEECESDESFIYSMHNLADNLFYPGLDRYKEKEFKANIESMCSEPWHFIVNGPSNHELFLKRLFPKLQKALK